MHYQKIITTTFIRHTVEESYGATVVLGLHALWKTIMQLRHADVHVKPQRQIPSVGQTREIYRAQLEAPHLVTVSDILMYMKNL